MCIGKARRGGKQNMSRTRRNSVWLKLRLRCGTEKDWLRHESQGSAGKGLVNPCEGDTHVPRHTSLNIHAGRGSAGTSSLPKVWKVGHHIILLVIYTASCTELWEAQQYAIFLPLFKPQFRFLFYWVKQDRERGDCIFSILRLETELWGKCHWSLSAMVDNILTVVTRVMRTSDVRKWTFQCLYCRTRNIQNRIHRTWKRETIIM
jgi:hypothetical protein